MPMVTLHSFHKDRREGQDRRDFPLVENDRRLGTERRQDLPHSGFQEAVDGERRRLARRMDFRKS